MNSTLNQIYTEGIKYNKAQEICRNVLIQKVSAYNFKNAQVKSIVSNLVQNIAFPIEYRTDIDQLDITRNGYRNLAYGLFAVGTFTGIALLSKKCSSDFWSIMSGLAIGLSFRVHKASKQTEIRKRNKSRSSNNTISIKHINNNKWAMPFNYHIFKFKTR